MKKSLVITVSFLVPLMFAGSALSHTISVDSPQNVQVNDTFTVYIAVSTTANVRGITTDITFYNRKLEALSVKEGQLFKQCSQRTFNAIPATINNSAGKITFVDMCLGNSGVSGSGNIAVIKFKAIAYGTSDISLQKTHIFDTNADLITSGVEINNGKVVIGGTDGDEELYKNSNRSKESNKTISSPPTELPAEKPLESNITQQETGNETINQSILQDEPANKTSAIEEPSVQSNIPSSYEIKQETQRQENTNPKQWVWVILLLISIFIILITIKKIKT